MIAFLGDVALLSNTINTRYEIDVPFVFNLEYVIGDDNSLSPTVNKVNLISHDADFENYFKNNPVAVTIANNHILDYGEEGLLSTKNILSNKEIGVIGEGPYWYSPHTCFFSYTCVGGGLKDKDLFSFSKSKCEVDVRTAKEQGARTVVVFIHWGIENQKYPSENQIKLAHWMIDIGVDLIIGNHPHCVQPIEKYKNKSICYSLGNCIFPNHNVDSHFDKNGISHRRWHTRWCSWNNESLVVFFDEESNEIKDIDILYCDRNGLHRKLVKDKANIFVLRKNNRMIQAIRKYALFIKSNVLVERKLLEVSAFGNEIKRKIKGEL